MNLVPYLLSGGALRALPPDAEPTHGGGHFYTDGNLFLYGNPFPHEMDASKNVDNRGSASGYGDGDGSGNCVPRKPLRYLCQA